MNKKQIFEQLRIYDNIIQNSVVDYFNSKPYYKVTIELENLYELLNFKGCNESFDDYVKEHCLDFITESLKMSKENIPEHLAKIENERVLFMEYTLKQLKDTSSHCVRCLKYAYDYYCPNEA